MPSLDAAFLVASPCDRPASIRVPAAGTPATPAVTHDGFSPIPSRASVTSPNPLAACFGRWFPSLRARRASSGADPAAGQSERQYEQAPPVGHRVPRTGARPAARSLLSRIVAAVASCFGFRPRARAPAAGPGPPAGQTAGEGT